MCGILLLCGISRFWKFLPRRPWWQVWHVVGAWSSDHGYVYGTLSYKLELLYVVRNKCHKDFMPSQLNFAIWHVGNLKCLKVIPPESLPTIHYPGIRLRLYVHIRDIPRYHPVFCDGQAHLENVEGKNWSRLASAFVSCQFFWFNPYHWFCSRETALLEGSRFSLLGPTILFTVLLPQVSKDTNLRR